MIKSIATSPEAGIRRENRVLRNFATVLQNIPAMDREINGQIQKYEDRQALSKRSAAQIRSR